MDQNNMVQKTTEAPGTGAIKNISSSRENDLGNIHTRNSIRNSTPTHQVALSFHTFNVFLKNTILRNTLNKALFH